MYATLLYFFDFLFILLDFSELVIFLSKNSSPYTFFQFKLFKDLLLLHLNYYFNFFFFIIRTSKMNEMITLYPLNLQI